MEQTLPKYPNLVPCLKLVNQIVLNFQFVQEVPSLPFINICQKQILAKQRNKKLRIQIGSINSYVETKLNIPILPN